MANQDKKKVAPVEITPEPQAPPEPLRRAFCLKHNIALGCGTRNRGTLIFTAEAEGKKWRPGTEKIAEGVTDYEANEAINNPQLLEAL